MKLLRNPVFTTGLVIVAIAVVVYQLGSSRTRFARLFTPPPLAQSPARPSVAPPPRPAQDARAPQKTNARNLLPQPIDREYAELHFDGWVEWPQRDPFLLLTPDPDEMAGPTETNSPVPTWKLKAILAQTGVRLAVINRGAYRERDEIEGYRIDHIDTGGVTFMGPRGPERLGFDTRPNVPGTNKPPVKPEPPKQVPPVDP